MDLLERKWKMEHQTAPTLGSSCYCFVRGGWFDCLPSFPESKNPLATTLWRPRLWSLSTRLKLKMFLLRSSLPCFQFFPLSLKAVLVGGPARMECKVGRVKAQMPRCLSSCRRPREGVVDVTVLWKKAGYAEHCWRSDEVFTCSQLPRVDRLWGRRLWKHKPQTKLWETPQIEI